MPRLSKCSFCNRTKNEVSTLLKGPSKGVYICNECIVSGNSYLQKSEDTEKAEKPSTRERKQKNISPEEIKKKLDAFVVGQDNAKKILSVAVYNHYKRIKTPVINGTDIEKSNIMLLGPSGSGKTLLVSNVAKILDMPYAFADATSLTEAGYVGQDVESIFERLYRNAGCDLERAQKGIVFIDEIDKKCIKQNTDAADSKGVNSEGVQQALLRMLEGDVITINNSQSSRRDDEPVEFDTRNVLFIVSGSFIGLENIVKKRLQTGSAIGFAAKLSGQKNDTELLESVEPEDLHKFGFIREFVGRFPILVAFGHLDEDMLLRILKEPKNNILDQYRGLFSVDGVDLEFNDTYLRDIARQCMERKTGARGLRAILEKTLGSIQFELPKLAKEGVKRIMIDLNGKPIYYKHKKKKEDK